MDTMLAGRFHLDSKKFAVEEVPVPVPGPGEILIEVKAAGVCLSDVHLLDGSLVPLFATSDTVTVGHEVSGVIHTLGPDLKRGLTVGTRVTLEAGKTCGQCAGCGRRRPCTRMRTAGIDYDGGWAQYTVAREDTLIPIPDNLPFLTMFRTARSLITIVWFSRTSRVVILCRPARRLPAMRAWIRATFRRPQARFAPSPLALRDFLQRCAAARPSTSPLYGRASTRPGQQPTWRRTGRR